MTPLPACVIVTGAGGPAGVAVIQALTSHHAVVAVDCDPTAVGLFLADRRWVVPRADDPRFVPALVTMVRESELAPATLVPTVAEELIALARCESHLRDAGIATWLPGESAVERCLDKWAFFKLCRDARIPVPDTALGPTPTGPPPWVLKPRFGRGSRDVYLVDDPQTLERLLPLVPDPLIQRRLAGREFTVDVLIARDGTLAGASPRWRLETKAGISTKGLTFRDETLISNIRTLVSTIGLTGPANIQGFVDDAGSPSFTEVNPRFSGGLPLTLAAGCELVTEYLRGAAGHEARPERLIAREGVSMSRYFSEVFTPCVS